MDTRGLIVAGWPWWWLLLLLLALLLLILLYCCLFWCLASRYRNRSQRRIIVNGSAATPLLGTMEKGPMESNLKALESRIDNIRAQLDTRAGKGDFEDGYVRGFRDASKAGGAGAARRRMDDEYGGMQKDWHGGYVQGLRDAGMSGLTQSMKNLADKSERSSYSNGYTQGFRDGNSGIFGDRITTTLLQRLEEQYPTQDDFRRGYVDGFKEGVGSRTIISTKDDTKLSENISQITDRLQTLERQRGDEIHSTKIYHVYNQTPGYGLDAGQQLASELDEMSTRRSTMRKHYTAGDYKYYGTTGSDNEGGYGGSLRHQRRSLSATALGRDDSGMYTTPRRGMHTSGTLRSQATGDSNVGKYTDAYMSKRYQYRSRSDLGTTPRRYASQTLLDGTRPGPTVGPTWRRDALEKLQQELDTLTRSPGSPSERPRGRPGAAQTTTAGGTTDLARGYSSDTGYLNDTLRSGRSAEYDSYQAEERNVRTRHVMSTTTSGYTTGPGVHAISPPPPPRGPSSRQWRGSPVSPAGAPMAGTAADVSSSGGGALKEVYHLVGMRGGQPTAQTGTLMSTSSTATTEQTVIPTSTTGAPNAGPQTTSAPPPKPAGVDK